MLREPPPNEGTMGLLSATASITRFAAAAPRHVDRVAIAAAVTRLGFRELSETGDGAQQACGWVGIHDPLTTELSPADLFFQHYLAVGFRFDRRAVPAQLLRLERRRLEEARRRERGVPRLGAAARREVKAEVEARLLARALPVPRLYDCLWNLETGRVYLTGGGRLARDAFGDLFRRTFGVEPVPMIPYVAAEHAGLSALALDTLRHAEPTAIMAVEHAAPAAPTATAAPAVPRLGLTAPAPLPEPEDDDDDAEVRE